MKTTFALLSLLFPFALLAGCPGPVEPLPPPVLSDAGTPDAGPTEGFCTGCACTGSCEPSPCDGATATVSAPVPVDLNGGFERVSAQNAYQPEGWESEACAWGAVDAPLSAVGEAARDGARGLRVAPVGAYDCGIYTPHIPVPGQYLCAKITLDYRSEQPSEIPCVDCIRVALRWRGQSGSFIIDSLSAFDDTTPNRWQRGSVNVMVPSIAASVSGLVNVYSPGRPTVYEVDNVAVEFFTP